MNPVTLSQARKMLDAIRSKLRPQDVPFEVYGMASAELIKIHESIDPASKSLTPLLDALVAAKLAKENQNPSMPNPIKPPQAMTRPPVTTKPTAAVPTIKPTAPVPAAPRAVLPVIPTTADRRLATAICDEQERRSIAAKSMTRAAFSKLSAKDAMAHCKNGGLIV